MTRLAHRSDLTNAQWKLLEPDISAAKRGGRQRTDGRGSCAVLAGFLALKWSKWSKSVLVK